MNSFLYRRLARWVTCQLHPPTGGTVRLNSKYAVASCADAVLAPQYWQLFALLERPPELVVDLGAHCGHFTVVADICCRSRFQSPAQAYIAVEANPRLIATIEQTVADAGIADRSTILHGFVGARNPVTKLWIHPKNYLISSDQPIDGGSPHEVPAVRVSEATGNRPIDVLKVDIEGGEFPLLEQEPQLFQQATILMLELHRHAGDGDRFIERLHQYGLREALPTIEQSGQRLLTMKASGPRA
jgi:FkbM family methyltransferase